MRGPVPATLRAGVGNGARRGTDRRGTGRRGVSMTLEGPLALSAQGDALSHVPTVPLCMPRGFLAPYSCDGVRPEQAVKGCVLWPGLVATRRLASTTETAAAD